MEEFPSRESFVAALESAEREFLRLRPELELSVYDRDTDAEGYVVVWNTMVVPDSPLGRCGKGGTRITPQVSLEELRMLAQTMALKNAAAGLPLGGAKSGLRGDPDAPDFERKYRAFVRAVSPVLVERGGIFGGFGFDLGARPIHALWACDELQSTRSFTGKPVEMGGTDYDREGIAGFGVVIAARAALRLDGRGVDSTTAAIQGLGAMGRAVFRFFLEFGGRVKFIGDPQLGGTYELVTPVREDLRNAIVSGDLRRARKLLEAGGGVRSELEHVLTANVDILFPCAVQDVVTLQNVSAVHARYVVEGANGPCTPEARRALFERGTVVVPDFLANAGGIIAAFIEMSSSLTPEENARTRGNVLKAKELTERKIEDNVTVVLQTARRLEVEPVAVGRHLALQRILDRRP